ncbi:hypothetical protein WN55_06104 [Dufourea novaeangliae]|uniref:SHSP domain-containing protein n=1 Tax=Dufourea novaeangliae TaxID=178035 RepID=A0A154P1V4_DUFNO|nr:hypothetical protein WN55_06104 [Dufourea novaeangliae]
MQIVSIGIRPDSVYEARMLLAPEADMSSIKITVKGNNLRVNVCKPLNEQLASQLPEITEKSVLGDLVKRTMKHCENLLIPDDIDGEKIIMDNLPHHCRENATTLKQNEYMNFDTMSNGVKTSLKFCKPPNFYIVDNKECYAAEMKIEGLKVGTANLANENTLNIKLHSSDDWSPVRNFNFQMPREANAKKVSVEVFNDTIFVRAPLRKRHA